MKPPLHAPRNRVVEHQLASGFPPFGQKCRDQGFNAGALVPVIAAIALHHDTEIITFDADFAAISTASPLRIRLLTRL